MRVYLSLAWPGILFLMALAHVAACQPRDCAATYGGDPDGDGGCEHRGGDTDSDTENEQSEAEQEEDSETPDAWPPVTPCKYCVEVHYLHSLDPTDPLLKRGEFKISTRDTGWVMPVGRQHVANERFIAYAAGGDRTACFHVCTFSNGKCFSVTVPNVQNFCTDLAMDGKTLVSSINANGSENPRRDLLVLDLDSLEYTIYSGAFNGGRPMSTPDLSGDILVHSQNLGIAVYNLATHVDYVIRKGEFQRSDSPTIEGSFVSWYGTERGLKGLYLFWHSLKDDSTRIIEPEMNGQKCSPTHHKGVLAWIEDCVGLWTAEGEGKLYIHDTHSGETTLIDPMDAPKDFVSIFEDRLVYTDLRNNGLSSIGKYINADVYLYDLTKQQGAVIADTPDSNQYDPVIHERWVLYRDTRWPYYDGFGVDLVLFDLCTLAMYQDDPMCVVTPEWAKFWHRDAQ